MSETCIIEEAAQLIYDYELRWHNSDHFQWDEAPEWIKRQCYDRAVMAYHPDGRPVPSPGAHDDGN